MFSFVFKSVDLIVFDKLKTLFTFRNLDCDQYGEEA